MASELRKRVREVFVQLKSAQMEELKKVIAPSTCNFTKSVEILITTQSHTGLWNLLQLTLLEKYRLIPTEVFTLLNSLLAFFIASGLKLGDSSSEDSLTQETNRVLSEHKFECSSLKVAVEGGYTSFTLTFTKLS